MANIKAFAAEGGGETVAELPYDVVTAKEISAHARSNPLSFFHVSKPEVDLPEGVDPYSPEVYAKAKENFEKLRACGALTKEPKPGFYLYRQIMGQHSQVGLVAVASCQEYLENKIKKHEFTRPDKEEDRMRHIETLDSQTGPAFFVYRALPELDAFFSKKTEVQPKVDFTAKDGVRHTTWVMNEPGEIDFIRQAFQEIPCLYIADGHHRTAAAVRIYQKRKGAGDSAWVLAVIFPHNQVQILPYNRVMKDLNGLTSKSLLQKLERVCVVGNEGQTTPNHTHQICCYLEGKWRVLEFRPELAQSAAKKQTSAVALLDVSLLQEHVIAPLFGIDNPRTSERLAFVGGIRGTKELEQLVNGGEFACAFSMYPTRIEELMAVADAGGAMPPKSTWFEPKLRDGLFCHAI